MVSFSFLFAALLIPLVSSFKPAFVTPQTCRIHRLATQKLYSAIPIGPDDPMFEAVERKTVQKKTPTKPEEPQTVTEEIFAGVATVNAVLLGTLLLFTTLAPTAAAGDGSHPPPPTPQEQAQQAIDAKNEALYEQNMAAEQMTYVNGADFF